MIAPMEQVEQGLKDWLQAGAWIASALLFVVTAVKFLSEFRQGRKQRELKIYLIFNVIH